eukprot:s1442_g10.t1
MPRLIKDGSKNRIAHRDLKAENVLLSSDESIRQTLLKVSDFGLSCYFKPNQIFTDKVGTFTHMSPEVGDEADEMVFLRRAAALLGSDVPEAARQDPGKAAFAEATRLLMAVVGFICEGHCPPMLRGNVVTRGPYLPAWSGMVPHIMLRDWFDANDASSVVNFFGSAWLRKAFEAADRSRRGQFVALLSRAAYAEVLRPGVRALRAPWQKVFESFPELGIFRALLTHVRRRLWEDARDRSRSRSRERKPKPEPKNEKKQEGVRFIVKNAGNLPASELEEHFQSFGKVLSCNVLIDKRTKKSRGVAFDWVLHETHICGHMKLEVTLAEVKQEKEEDEDRKREERVEERTELHGSRSRVEKEQRMSRTLGGVATLSERGEERLVPSHWHKRWRNQLFEFLPRGPSGPTPWGDPRVTAICAAMWTEVAEHAARTGDRTDREKIFVGGLPHHCTLDMLTAHFGKYGRITDAVVMADKATGKPRGFGFVVFEHISCVEAAIRDYGKHAIDGKWVDVKRATPQECQRNAVDLPGQGDKMMSHRGRHPILILSELYTSSCDVWACGVILYNLMSGGIPFGTEEEIKAVRIPLGKQWCDASQDVVGFLKKLLSRPAHRPPAKLALQDQTGDPFFQKHLPKPEMPTLRFGLLDDLRTFRSQNKLKRSSLTTIASMLAEEHVQAARDMFISMDTDGDGLLCVAEVEKRLRKQREQGILEKDVTRREVERIFRDFDSSLAGSSKDFTYTEFLAATFNRKACLTDAVVQEAFKILDKNNDGSIDLDELSSGRTLGHIPIEELQQILEDMDQNGDKQIDLQEFKDRSCKDIAEASLPGGCGDAVEHRSNACKYHGIIEDTYCQRGARTLCERGHQQCQHLSRRSPAWRDDLFGVDSFSISFPCQ